MYEEVKFFSFNKKLDWEKGISDNLTICDEGLSIKQTLKYGIQDSVAMNEHPHLAMIYDFTIGKNERMYLLDETSSIWTYDYRNKHLERLIKDRQMFTYNAQLASFGDFLFIAEPNKHLLAYSLSNSQMMWERSSWNNKPFYPLAIATSSSSGHVFVAVANEVERDEAGEAYLSPHESLSILEIGISGEVLSTYKNDSFRLQTRSKPLHVKYQIAIEVTKNGAVYLFDKKDATLYEYTKNGQLGNIFSVSEANHYSGVCSDSSGHFFIGNHRNWDAIGEDDRFIISVSANNDKKTFVSSYRGRGDKLMIDERDRIFVWDAEKQLLTILALEKRTLEREANQLLEGVFISTALDTKEEKMKWHKLLVEGELRGETKMSVSYYAADDRKIVLDGEIVDLNEYLQDETIPFAEKEKRLQRLWTGEISNPTDALLFDAEGRYLWFQMKLIGSETQTPFVNKIRLYFPRTSYLSYLPAFYQEDKASSEFLERFLSLFSKFLLEMDEQIDRLPNYFDPNLVSGDFLKWLSSWIGIATDDSWSDEKLRELIRFAPYLYRKRGTKEAITKMVEIYTGETPFIIEHFQLKLYKQQSHLHRIIEKLYGDNPYFFYVLIKSEVIQSEQDRMMIQQILDAEKPAFTEAKLIVLEPWIYLDMHSYLEINTFLSERSLMTLNNKSYMPTDTLLIDLERENRFDIHTRMGLDSKLE